MSRGLSLALIAALGVSLAACGTIKSVYDRGRGVFAPRHQSDDGDRTGSGRVSPSGFDANTNSNSSDNSGDNPGQSDANIDPRPERHVREVQFPVMAQSVSSSIFGDDMTDVFASASVPVLAPSGMTSNQAAGFARSYRTTPDGYFARMSGDDYDVVINGTHAYAVAPPDAGARTRDTSTYQFSESETGLGVTFGRFGADYAVDFECRGSGDEAGMDCITQQAATRFVERLIPVGGGGQ